MKVSIFVHDCKRNEDQLKEVFNPIALRTTKTLWSFGCSEYNRVKMTKFSVMLVFSDLALITGMWNFL